MWPLVSQLIQIMDSRYFKEIAIGWNNQPNININRFKYKIFCV